MKCPICDERLTAETDAEHYRRSGGYRYDIVCLDCGYRRPAEDTPADGEIIDNASERYWTAAWRGEAA